MEYDSLTKDAADHVMEAMPKAMSAEDMSRLFAHILYCYNLTNAAGIVFSLSLALLKEIAELEANETVH